MYVHINAMFMPISMFLSYIREFQKKKKNEDSKRGNKNN